MPVRRFRLHLVLLLVACLSGASVTAAAYWPGFMPWDAIRQYDQAVTGDFDDWHPPMMEWVWRRFLRLTPGPAPMLTLQLMLEWGGLALFGGKALHDGRARLAAAAVACGFLPFALALSGEILKDCLMAGALLAAVGLLVWCERSVGRTRASLAIGAVALLVFASTLRFNAFLASVPLCVALLPPAATRTRLRLAASVLMSAAVMLAALPVANRLIGARASDVSLSLVIFDLGGITRYGGQDVFPPHAADPPVADPVAANARCYNLERWDSYSWWVDPLCPTRFETVQRAFRTGHLNPYAFWLRAVLTHPVAYAEHRLAHFGAAARLSSRARDERPVQLASPPNDWGYALHPNRLTLWLDAAAVASGTTPLGWPAIWIACALALLAIAPALPSRRIVTALALSAAAYGLGYAIVGVASELRYHLWTMLATALAGVVALADLGAGAAVPQRRSWVAGAIPMAVLLAACAERLLSAS